MNADPHPESGHEPGPESGQSDQAELASPAPTKARSNAFFRQRRTPLPRDDARRQGDISQLAFLTMGGRDPAIAFLNAENPALGGRPLAIATASDAGYEQVATAIRAWNRDPGFE